MKNLQHNKARLKTVNRFNQLVRLTLFGTVITLAGCGGGGGGSAVPAAAPSPLSFTNGQAAAVVVGQPDFVSKTIAGGAAGLNSPYTSVHVSNGKLYVSDYENHRVQVFNNIPTSNGASADYALGQPDLTSTTSGTSATQIAGPQSPFISGGKLFVTEWDNNRISIYNTVPTAGPGTIDVVIGQINKTDSLTACNATSLYNPETVMVVGTKMIVTDTYNNRVLIWNSIPTADGVNADLVLGQPNMTTCTGNTGGISESSLSGPAGAWTDGSKLVVNDSGNHRVLIWNSFPTSDGQPADLVLGQLDFTSAQLNQGGVASASTMSNPYDGVYVLNDQLFIADSNNHRVLIWNSFPTSNAQAADLVLGQNDFAGVSLGTTQTMFDAPSGVYASGNQVFVTDQANNRIMIFNSN